MTFIFDTMFGQSKKISRRNFNKAIRSISSISNEERKYLNQAFNTDLSDGLSLYELKQRIGKLRYNQKDPLDYYEVEQVKKKLLEEFK